MEYYIMPQVDKSASTYSPPVQYAPTIAPSTPTLARPEINKYGVSSDILTSCDWSAVIHRPAEDSEPEDLPSTVDMDAIKEPATPLPPMTPCPLPPENESDSDDESSDSDGESSSESNSDSHEGSGSSRSWSESESSESTEKRQASSSSSSRSHSPQTTFSIRETNFDQGGLKLKISATKSKSKSCSQSSSSSDPYDSTSSSESEEGSGKKKKKDTRNSDTIANNVTAEPKVIPNKEEEKLPRRSARSAANAAKAAAAAANVSSSGSEVKKTEEVKNTGRIVNKRNKMNTTVTSTTSNNRRPSRSPVKKPVKMLVKGTRRSPRIQVSFGVHIRLEGASSSESASSEDENDDGEEGESASGDEIAQLAKQLGSSEHSIPISEQLQVINEEDLAAILPDVGGGGSLDGFEDVGGTDDAGTGRSGTNSGTNGTKPTTSSTSSTLPNRATTGGGASSSSSSSSDVEELLPEQEQIVSQAISRIHVDSDNGKEEPQPSTPRSNQDDESAETELLSRGGSGGSSSAGAGESCVHENEANSKCSSEIRRKRGRPPKNVPSVAGVVAGGMPELEAYCSQSNVSPDSGIQSVAGSPAGGGVRDSPPASPASPPSGQPPPLLKPSSPSVIRANNVDRVLYPPRRKHNTHLPSNNDKITKMHTSRGEMRLENGGKRGPGRPKGSGMKTSGISVLKNSHLGNRGRRRGKKRLRRIESQRVSVSLSASAAKLKVPPFIANGTNTGRRRLTTAHGATSPLLLGLPGISAPAKRGRGRPKKTPPVLEPVFPLEGTGSKKENSDNCSKRTSTISGNISTRRRCSKDNGVPNQISDKNKGKNLSKLSLPKGLMRNKQHKHKKRKSRELTLDPKFIEELEKLAGEFEKSCYIAQGGYKQKCEGNTIPPVFRVKKVFKKKKGIERVKEKEKRKDSDKESKESSEVEATPQKEKLTSPTATPTPQPSNNAKRRVKKSTVEIPKNRDKPEANNEQRLPLKKRHYHMSNSTTSTNQSSTDSAEKSDSSVDSIKDAKTAIKSVTATTEKANEKHHSVGKGSHISSKPTQLTANGTKATISKVDAKKTDLRNVSETMVITDSSTSISTEHDSVIVTPKKRHCIELEKKSTPSIKHLVSKEKEVQSSISTKKTTSRNSNANHNPAVTSTPQVGTRTSARHASMKQETDSSKAATSKSNSSIVQSPAPVTRSQRIQNETQSNETSGKKVAKSIEEAEVSVTESKKIIENQSIKAEKPKSEKSEKIKSVSSEKCEKPTSTVVEDISAVEYTKTPSEKTSVVNEKVADTPSTPLSTRSASKAVVTSSATAEVKTSALTNSAENVSTICLRSKIDRKPPAGVFEPSTKLKAEAIDNIIKTPTTPPPVKSVAEVLSKIKHKLTTMERKTSLLNLQNTDIKNLKIKRPVEDMGDTPLGDKLKKRKVICDVRVHVTKLSPSDILLQKMMGSMAANKLKVKRKKINRTGFPIKKKKKKKMFDSILVQENNPSSPPILEDQTKISITATASECTPALSPATRFEEAQKVKDEPRSDASPTPEIMETPVADIKIETPAEEVNQEKPEIRPASKRIMEMKAKSSETSERRKRKNTIDEQEMPIVEEEDLTDIAAPDPLITPSFLTAKRMRKTKDDYDDSDADSIKLRRKSAPRWRKKYLPAGLFSDYFKEDVPRKPSTESYKSKSIYTPADFADGLLPPPAYCSKWVRQRRLPFQLPYDLWWLHINNQLPGREAVPSWHYKKIKTNVYYDVKPTLNYEAQACNCRPTDDIGCGEDCINRMILTECSPQSCPCGDKCSNQKIQRHEWAPDLLKFMTKDKGWGVKTRQKIEKDKFILEYVGEVVSDREFKSRMQSRYQNDTHHYCLNLDGGLVIDGHRMGGDGRFVNHSCEPNCEMQKWCVNGLFRMALFALRDIEAEEELTYDYNFSLFNPTEGQQCKCGSSKCRGVIGGKSQRVVSLQGSSTALPTTHPDEKPPGLVVGRPRKPRNCCRRKPTKSEEKLNTANVPQNSTKNLIAKDSKSTPKENHDRNALATVAMRLTNLAQVKLLSPQHKAFVLAHKCFLIRNLEKVKVVREKLKQAVRGSNNAGNDGGPSGSGNGNSGSGTNSLNANGGAVFLTQLNALSCPRNIRTRRLAQAEDNPEMTKTAKLACILKELYSVVSTAKDEEGELLSSAFVTLPSKRKYPLYYQRVQNPIDLTTIEQNIITGVYKTVEPFDNDMTRLFKNNVRWHGRTTDLGIAATRLRKIYNLAKIDCLPKLEKTLGAPPPASFIPHQEDPGGEEEDVIRCICGLFRDEGLMIQCERCLVWQHCYCVRANPSAEQYLCERCHPRDMDLEIPSQEDPDPTKPGQVNYITLLRGEMLLKQGDTVYVLRDIVNEESKTIPKAKHTYKTIKNWKYTDCDIFKIERLWKDEKGDRFAFGHHYLRPHETFHEPTRKFFPNELMRVPLYEVVPVELVMGLCYVLDLNTYCKGRPLGANPEHIYVCEYRVDKAARMFAKIPRPKHSNVSTKSYAFELYDQRLKPLRTYAPHGMTKPVSTNNNNNNNNSVSRGRGGRSAHHAEENTTTASTSSAAAQKQTAPTANSLQISQIPIIDKRTRQKARLNRILLKLLSKLPSKQPLDLSFLLEPGRRQRKKPPLLAS
ncbi:histone-lysine N-methyltransferase ash1 isoform X3 [Rhodnius prolixus]|uniref:histone-lysine N-methyltransferase ash1 isoform X3 n=1 Tax=Rhodnius prolixus TaxID=13249 RepID=UPI003D18CE89